MCKSMEDMRNQSLQEGIEIGMETGMEKGMEKGKKEGVQETMLHTARRMLEAGKYTLHEIAGISGLSLNEIKALQAGS